MPNAADRRTTLLAQAASFPASPGVYLFKDGDGRVLYVGTSINIRARVRSYFGREDRRRPVSAESA